jgi:hypothetical protein
MRQFADMSSDWKDSRCPEARELRCLRHVSESFWCILVLRHLDGGISRDYGRVVCTMHLDELGAPWGIIQNCVIRRSSGLTVARSQRPWSGAALNAVQRIRFLSSPIGKLHINQNSASANYCKNKDQNSGSIAIPFLSQGTWHSNTFQPSSNSEERPKPAESKTVRGAAWPAGFFGHALWLQKVPDRSTFFYHILGPQGCAWGYSYSNISMAILMWKSDKTWWST